MEPLITEERPRWSGRQLVWLLGHKGVGPARALQVAVMIPDPGEFADRWPGVRERLSEWAREIPAADPVLEDRYGDVSCVGFFDDAYPEPLTRIPNPPPALWVVGRLPDFTRAVAVVGTRHPDKWGKTVAAYAARWVTELPGVVVSGLAMGCDAIAHEETLAHGGITVAVLGGSLRSPSPAANRPLADAIVERGGALVSEVTPDVAVSPRTLVQRNRLQSGLSLATVIAQTSIPGGTLHTARFALEQQRILVVPEPTGSYRNAQVSTGNVALTTSPPPSAGEIAQLLAASKRLSASLAVKERIADAAPTTHDELRTVLQRLMP